MPAKTPTTGDHLCGPFVVRCYPGGQTMFAGTLDTPPLPEGREELWVCEFALVGLRRFKMPKCFRGYRIDQILTQAVDPSILQPIDEQE